MEFGKVRDTHILDQIEWRGPSIDPRTSGFLRDFKSDPSTQLWIGAPAWNHKEWVGKIYPPKTKPADYLKHYSQFFNTIELNTTHYRIPTPEQTKKWRSQVSSDFLFCPKVYQGISHERGGLVDAPLIRGWLQFLENLGTQGGPSFLQLPPSFDYGSKLLLFKFLQGWPAEHRLALEFRHPSWFQNGSLLPALTEYLHSKNMGVVILDVAGRRDLFHGGVTTEFTMVRYIGNSLHATDYVRAANWNTQLAQWEVEGLKKVFFFVHQPEDIFVPEMTAYLRELSFFKSKMRPPVPVDTLQFDIQN